MPVDKDVVNSITITEAPSTLQKRYEYNTDTTVAYAGSAPRGRASSDPDWNITKYTYNGSQQVTQSQVAFDSWDNRTLASYS